MNQRLPITIRLDSFEGPLDLLLYLIQMHELDISEVSLSKITDQYLAYVQLMQELNFDTASEFLVMAATLLHWKSRALLPQDVKDTPTETLDSTLTSQEMLVRQLIQHQRFLEAGNELTKRPQLGLDVFLRGNPKPTLEKVWRTMNISDLGLTYQDLLIRSRKRSEVLKKETVSIQDKIQEFARRLTLGQRTEIHQLLSMHPSRSEMVATFLAALELGRLKKLRLYQAAVYAELYLELLETLQNFDPHLASGFHHIHEQPFDSKTKVETHL